MDTVDGDYQAMKANDGAFVRKHFFGQHPKLLEMVAKMSDDDIWRLNRGGHDPQKVMRPITARSTPRPADGDAHQDRKGFAWARRWGKNTAHQTIAHRRRHQGLPATRFNIP